MKSPCRKTKNGVRANRDFRYQLTVIDQFAQAIVAKKIANNTFTIRTNKPGVEVSWQITGIRHDASSRPPTPTVQRQETANHVVLSDVKQWSERCPSGDAVETGD
jgi:hypothetical protein